MATDELRDGGRPSASQEHSGLADKQGTRRALPGVKLVHPSSDWGHLSRDPWGAALGGQHSNHSRTAPLDLDMVPSVLQGALGGGITKQSNEKGPHHQGAQVKSSCPRPPAPAEILGQT